MPTKKKNSPSNQSTNALRLEYVPLDTLKLWDKNPKKHDLAQITESIYRYGFQDPAKFDETLGGLIFGNGRTEALVSARNAGKEPPKGIMLDKKGAWCVPVLFGNDLASESAASAFAIDHNNLTMAGSHTPEDMAKMWSAEGYQSLMQSLKSASDLPITAWMPKDDKPEDPGAQMDKAEELLEKWKVKTGDLWEIGEHRILCGDCTKREDAEHLMSGEQADMVFTDPPYGVAIGDKNKFLKSFQKAGRNLENIAGDLMGKDELFDMLVLSFTLTREFMKDCCAIYVTAPQGGELGMMMMMMMMSGLPVRHVLNWIKNSPTFSMGRLDYDYQHEPILFSWKKTHKHYGRGKYKTSTWFIDKPRASKEHPTMKPVELVENAILNSSDDGQIIYEPFSGSGTTLVACERLGRKGRAIEIAPKYVAVALERLAGMGLTPKKLGN